MSRLGGRVGPEWLMSRCTCSRIQMNGGGEELVLAPQRKPPGSGLISPLNWLSKSKGRRFFARFSHRVPFLFFGSCNRRRIHVQPWQLDISCLTLVTYAVQLIMATPFTTQSWEAIYWEVKGWNVTWRGRGSQEKQAEISVSVKKRWSIDQHGLLFNDT